jgi:hypothetical protein
MSIEAPTAGYAHSVRSDLFVMAGHNTRLFA